MLKRIFLKEGFYKRNYSSAAKTILRRYDAIQRAKLLEAEHKKTNFVQNQENVEATILTNVESFAAEKFLKSNLLQFDSFARKRESEFEKLKIQQLKANEDQTSSSKMLRPFSAEDSLNMINNNLFSKEECVETTENNLEKNVNFVVDRGFFVRKEGFVDEYTEATADEVPESDMNELPFEVYNFEDGKSVESISMTNPGQCPVSYSFKKTERFAQKLLNDIESDNDVGEWMSNYGIESNETIPPLVDEKCYGCGANFHCNSASLPGFVPVNMFEEIEINSKLKSKNQRTDFLCRRCFLYKKFNFLLNVNVCNVDYRSIMGHLKLVQEALILLIVDMTDLQGSINAALPEIIGTGKPMIVIGNKVDLLPPDGEEGYLKRYYETLKRTIKDAGFADKFNIMKYSILSAKTGFGVEDLITNIYLKWVSARGPLRSNIYVVGCTNAGKSTLFNTFLQSDLCKVRAMDLVERVTTSIWPGTTLSLLKFPIWNPTHFKLELRRRRLIKNQKLKWKEKFIAANLYKSTKNTQYITLQGYVGNTFKATEDQILPVNVEEATKNFFGEVDSHNAQRLAQEGESKLRMNLNDQSFKSGNWCYDTPGTVNDQQLLDLFTLEELVNVIPRSLIIPRTFILYYGESLLIGGIGRIDLLSAKKFNGDEASIFLTVFASDRLPLNHMKTYMVNEYLNSFAGSKLLGAPIGDKDRLQSFPKLLNRTFNVKNNVENRSENSCGDILLSSVGWVSITSALAESVQVKAWTPEARGLGVRTPSLLKCPEKLRGKRIPGTSAYNSILPAHIEESIYLRGSKKTKGKRLKLDFKPRHMGKELPTTCSFDLA